MDNYQKEELMVFWKEFLSNTALLFFVGWLIKTLTKHLLSKDVENYKKKLEIESKKEIETLIASLQRTALEHKVRFSRLDEQRAEIIGTIYSKMGEAMYATKLFLLPSRNESMSLKKKKGELARKKIRLLADYFNRRRIFLSEELCNAILEFTNLLEEKRLNRDLYTKKVQKEKSKEERQKIWNQISQRESDMRKTLEREFRSILGVYDAMGKESG